MKISIMKSEKNAAYVKKDFCYNKNEKVKLKLNKIVRDHCHCTRKFRAAAHSICNLNYKLPQ